LQDAWDKHKTVRQNYLALGLVHTLNPLASGGVEFDPLQNAHNDAEMNQTPSTVPVAGPSTTAIPRGHGKIVRNEDGDIVGVEFAEDDSEDNTKELDMDQLEPEVEHAVMKGWVVELGGGKSHASGVVSAKQVR
jgi:nucleolar protein 16